MAEPSAKTENAGGEDPSMEEILQSIRRIIAEEGDEGQAAPDAPKPKASESAGEIPGSEVLELTEMVNDDGTVVSLKNGEDNNPSPPATVEAAPATAALAASTDVLSQIEQALADTPATPRPAAPIKAVATGDALLAPQTQAAAAASLSKLRSATEPPPPAPLTPSPAFRSGSTVEDLVAEMIRPMIKEWLDKNLPAIVERIVEREVRRLSK